MVASYLSRDYTWCIQINDQIKWLNKSYDKKYKFGTKVYNSDIKKLDTDLLILLLYNLRYFLKLVFRWLKHIGSHISDLYLF